MTRFSSFAVQYSNVDFNAVSRSSIDLFITEGAPLPRPGSLPTITDAQVATLVGQGRTVVGYVNVAITDAARSYWQNSWTTTGDDLAPLTGTAPTWLQGRPRNGFGVIVDFTNSEWQSIVIAQAVELVRRGYSGVFLDDVAAYDDAVTARDTPAGQAAIRLAATQMAEFVVRIKAAITAVDPDAVLIVNSDPYLPTNVTADARGAAAATAFLAATDGHVLENMDAAAIDYAVTTTLRTEERLILESDGTPAFAPADAWSRGTLYTAPSPAYSALGISSPPAGAGADTFVGGDGPNVYDGKDGDDVLRGNGGNDVLTGGAGNDFIVMGPGGEDTAYGGDGDDIIAGLTNTSNVPLLDGAVATMPVMGGPIIVSGGDRLYGGAGNDRLLVGYGSTGDGGSGIDTAELDLKVTWVPWVAGSLLTTFNMLGVDIDLGAAASGSILVRIGDELAGLDITLTRIERFYIELGGGDDRVTGGAYDDVLFGEVYNFPGGDDVLDGAGGNDRLYGGVGRDILNGGAGNDDIDGGQRSPGYDDYDRDELNGGAGDDRIVAGIYDRVDGGAGIDTLRISYLDTDFSYALDLTGIVAGGTIDIGNGSVITGIERIEQVQLSEGNDVVLGTEIDDRIIGGGGNDRLEGRGGDDQLDGNHGDDILIGGAGADRIDGGSGIDLLSYAGSDAGVTVRLGSWGVGGHAQDDINSGMEDIEGSRFADGLTGGAGTNSLIGLAGNDILDGGSGNDRLYGGLGDDSFYVDSQGDLVFEEAGQGTDTVVASTSFYLFANVERLTLAAGGANWFGVGNALSNAITGNQGSNLLLGGGGSDRIEGAGGDDQLFGETGDDILTGGGGVDYLAGGADDDRIEGGDGADALYGEGGDDDLFGGTGFFTDILVGGDGADVLDGNSGEGDYDLLDGGAGDDLYFVDTPDDLTFEAAGGGTDGVVADIRGAGYYLYANVETLTLMGETPFGVGNALDNVLIGSGTANWLLGGAGDDRLNGGGGNDVLFGEAGADRFEFSGAFGIDTIGDFAANVDKIALGGLGLTWSTLQSRMTEIGGSTAIQLADGSTIILAGVAKASLDADDFLF